MKLPINFYYLQNLFRKKHSMNGRLARTKQEYLYLTLNKKENTKGVLGGKGIQTFSLVGCKPLVSNFPHYYFLPRTCCSRVVIRLTAFCRTASFVSGLLGWRCIVTMLPNSLNASLMSRTRTLSMKEGIS